MDAKKKKNLEETYQRILNVGFCIVPYEDISEIIGPDPMVYGTAKDERILSFEGVEALFKSQFEQMGNMKPAIDRKRIALRISNGGNNACIIEELTFTLSSDEEIHTIFMRATCVMEYLDNQWKITHWHTSTPVDTENDPWHMEEWKREKEKLQRLVDEQTVALKQNNRELQIEAALEKIRSSSLAMQKTEDLGDVVKVLFEQMQGLSVDMGFASVSIFIFENGSRNIRQWLPLTDGVSSLGIPYFDHPISSDLFDAKDNGADYFEKVYTLEEKNTWLELGFELTDYKDLPEEFKSSLFQAPGYAIAITLAKNSGICIPSFVGILPSPEDVEIMKRVGKVFEQAYIRFLDLQKAEAQAREAQIEAALERVRSKSLAMHKTAELQSVIHTVHQELLNLNLSISGGSFIVINKEIENDLLCWGSGGTADTSDIVHIPHFEKPFYTHLLNKIKSDPGFFTEEYTNEEKIEFFSFLFQHEPWSNLDSKQKEETLSAPGGYTRSCIVSKHTSIFIINHFGAKFSEAENAILSRFGKVFEQSYTRFLDLQKAEAQAREAQIEAALERVRAQTMAMHSSEDVGKCVVKMFAELTALGVDEGTRFGIGILNHDNENNQLWTARKDGEEVNMHIGHLDMSWHPLLKSAREAWKAQVPIHKYVLEGEDLLAYYEMLNTAPDYKIQIPLEKLPKKEIQHCFIFEHGFFYAFTPLEFQPELIQITKRFSSLFEQTYRRYLDLVKAEAQAREAQIEAALERVRSRTMAMHSSADVDITVITLFDELVNLGGDKNIRSGIGIMDTSRKMEVWTASTNRSGHTSLDKGLLDMDIHPLLEEVQNAWEARKLTYTYELVGDDLIKYFRAINDSPDYSFQVDFERLPEKIIHYDFFFPEGVIFAFSPTPLSEEFKKVFKRFAEVFGQTYTRFLDLQKAEAQAREGQIEAALEKVRSRSLAMHKSDELNDVVTVLFEKFKELQIPFTAVGIAIGIEGSKDLNSFVCGENETGLVITNYRLPYFDHIIAKDFNNVLEKQLDFFVGHYSKVEKDSFYTYVIEHTPELRYLPEDIKRMVFESTTYTISMVAVKNALFAINDFEGKLLVESEIDIIKRFARVFDQAYTRFLDLQKAEAQSREAQIEVAVERVRAQSMAMHHTDDLHKVTEELLHQLNKLAVDGLTGTTIYLVDADDIVTAWDLSSPGNIGTPGSFTVTYDAKKYPVLGDWVKTWRTSDQNYFALEFPKEALLKAVEEWKEVHPEIAGIIKNAIDSGKLTHQWSPAGRLSKGILAVDLIKPPTNDTKNIVTKMSGAFNLAYQRFEDLQKAEAQAREVEIELALERVRARTMAMQHSDELTEASEVLDQQVRSLGIETWGCAFHIYADDPEGDHEWFSSREGNLPFYKTPREKFFLKFYEKGQAGEIFHVEEFIGEDCKAHYDFLMTIPVMGDVLSEIVASGASLPESQYDHIAFFNHGYILFITYEPVPESHAIFQRFAKVFEQTYTRFLDLQKAEAQAREAKIEAALEKIRSRTMGMQSSDELPLVANLLFTEVRALGIHAWSCGYNILAEDKKTATCCMSSEGTLQTPFQLRLRGEASFDEMGDFIHSDEIMLVQELGGKALESHYAYMKSFPDLKPTFDEIERLGLSLPTYQINHLCKFNQGFILFITYEKVPDAHDIFKRFTRVFDQTYTRFLDLQKAEAQAREAKIEVALEKVRSRTMGMQKSDELADVANVLFQEMNELVHNLWTCGFVLCEKDRQEDEWWLSLEDGFTRGFFLPNVNDYAHAHLYEGWLKKDDFRTAQLEGEKLQDHYNWLMEIPIAKSIFDDMEAAGMERPEWQKLHAAYFSKGYLVIITREPCPEEAIFKRFSQVFDLTYTRFLDLKKAEEQAREAQIEASLEKVRSRSLAMQSPVELIEVAQLLREEMGALGVEELETSSIYIHDENSGLTQCWFTIKNTDDPAKAVTDQMAIDLQDTWVGRQMLDFYRSPENQTSILMQGANREAWIQYCEEKTDLFGTSNFYGDTIPERTYHLYKFSNGYIGAAAPGEISKESWDLLKRATAVFSFAYTRFQDLQKAEASAIAAMRQASLDRIRADISSMRHADDLDRITPLIFKELTVLGVPFIRCGVFIIHEKEEIVEAYLSSPDGISLGVLKLPYHASELTYQTVEAWRKGLVYRQHWNKEDFIQWIEQLMEQDQIQDSRTYQGTAVPPESLDLHFVPFAQGMLYVGALSPLDEMELELVQALAKAFSIAFARYEDFVKLDKAKSEVESAMSELKATQSQLVQQEKLASLGQLTAGIAHEIKNPLNFVNNFSEVSIEMIEEVLEARSERRETRSQRQETKSCPENREDKNQEGEWDESEEIEDEILEDIKANLKKIHEHGSRANGIVTSMLQHSRGGTGKKEPTDINALIKEYSNLAFHGMRAGKNPINAAIDLQLDEQIKEVPLIGEDFSRVLLNLCNNAFDAMRTTAELRTPKLTIRTKLKSEKILIEVEDNGPGIPDEIKDKILQPFFTTKKGTEGTGLGLSITHDIVKAHGGELTAASQNGEMTMFLIQIPIKD